jgi:hypothetical protein
MTATLKALIGNGSLTAGACLAPTADRPSRTGRPLGADMSGRTLERAAATDSVVSAPPGLGARRERAAAPRVSGSSRLH